MKGHSTKLHYPILGAVPAIGWTVLVRGQDNHWKHAKWVICFAVYRGGIIPMVEDAVGIVGAGDLYDEYTLRFEGVGA